MLPSEADFAQSFNCPVCELRSLSQQMRTQLQSLQHLTPQQLSTLVRAQANLNRNELSAVTGKLTDNQIRAAVAQLRHDIQALHQTGANPRELLASLHTATQNHEPPDLFPPIAADDTPADTRAARSPASEDEPIVAPPIHSREIHPANEGVGGVQ